MPKIEGSTHASISIRLTDRFEVAGANAARDFLRHSIPEQEISQVWTYMHPVVALVTAGVEMDALAIDFNSFTDSYRNVVVQAFPRRANFKEDILHAFYDDFRHKPETTFGNVKMYSQTKILTVAIYAVQFVTLLGAANGSRCISRNTVGTCRFADTHQYRRWTNRTLESESNLEKVRQRTSCADSCG